MNSVAKNIIIEQSDTDSMKTYLGKEFFYYFCTGTVLLVLGQEEQTGKVHIQVGCGI